MVPYLKGLHLTLESWREDRDSDRCRKTPQAWAEVPQNKFLRSGDHTFNPDLCTSDAPPKVVTPVNRFKDDVQALGKLTESETPPRILVRPNGATTAALMWGDASGTGFGTSLWVQG
ncbi:hypothetical protein ACA910_007627 [Epithemia clementina (nom. ined.)]